MSWQFQPTSDIKFSLDLYYLLLYYYLQDDCCPTREMRSENKTRQILSFKWFILIDLFLKYVPPQKSQSNTPSVSIASSSLWSAGYSFMWDVCTRAVCYQICYISWLEMGDSHKNDMVDVNDKAVKHHPNPTHM